MGELFLEDPDSQNYEGEDSTGELDPFENCTHDFSTEGYCVACGIETGPKILYNGGYSESHIKAKSSTEHDYYREVDKVDGLSSELKEVVATKLNQDAKHTRESTRAQRTFCEIYIAGAKLGELKPDHVADCLGMGGRGLNKSLRVVSGTSRGTIKDEDGQVVTMPIVSISPVKCVAEICTVIDKGDKIKPHIAAIESLVLKASSRHPPLLNERPKHVAAGFTKYYCQIKSLPIQDIASLIGISNPTLNHYTSKAKKICEDYKLLS